MSTQRLGMRTRVNSRDARNRPTRTSAEAVRLCVEEGMGREEDGGRGRRELRRRQRALDKTILSAAYRWVRDICDGGGGPAGRCRRV